VDQHFGHWQPHLIEAAFEARDFAAAMRQIMKYADEVNELIHELAPWEIAKDSARSQELHRACSLGIQMFYLLSGYLKPVLPAMMEKIEHFLNSPLCNWQAQTTATALSGMLLPAEHRINPYQHLMTRIDPKQIRALVAANQRTIEPDTGAHSQTRHAAAQQSQEQLQNTCSPIAETISIEDFSKVDLRIARIIRAEQVEDAKKLLKLTLDIGSGRRTVFAGIKSAYTPE